MKRAGVTAQAEEGELPPRRQVFCDDLRADTNAVLKNRQHNHREGTQQDLLQDEADVSDTLPDIFFVREICPEDTPYYVSRMFIIGPVPSSTR